MSNLDDYGFGTQIRKSPFFDSTLKYGAQGFSVYNHMYIPRDFGDPEQNFWNLVNQAILCDVSVERQVEISGTDASKFIQFLTPRDLRKMAVGQCKYVLITNAQGGVINDPIILKLEENKFWISLADSDVLLWAQGVAVNLDLDVIIREPDASPVQLQGPRSMDIMKVLFGNTIEDLKYYWLCHLDLDGMDLVVSRTGWSSELGYEIFLQDRTRGNELWDKIMKAGESFGLKPGHTSTIRRIEGGMLSYHADMDIYTNPFELGLERLVSLESPYDFIGKTALKKILSKGIKRKQVGLKISGKPFLSPNTNFWPIKIDGYNIGKVTSAVYSPRLKENIALAMVNIKYSNLGTQLIVETSSGPLEAKVVKIPFYDPRKLISKNIKLHKN